MARGFLDSSATVPTACLTITTAATFATSIVPGVVLVVAVAIVPGTCRAVPKEKKPDVLGSLRSLRKLFVTAADQTPN
jgi:hypothetical protein